MSDETPRTLVMGELTPEQRAAHPDAWDCLFQGQGLVTRDPQGRVFLEVSVGAAFWIVPMPEHMMAELAADTALADASRAAGDGTR